MLLLALSVLTNSHNLYKLLFIGFLQISLSGAQHKVGFFKEENSLVKLFSFLMIHSPKLTKGTEICFVSKTVNVSCKSYPDNPLFQPIGQRKFSWGGANILVNANVGH